MHLRSASSRHIVWDWNGTLLADNDAVITAVNAVIAGFAAGVKDYAGLVELCRTHASGTLLDDNHAVLTSVNTVCARYGRASVTLDEWRAIFDRPLVRSYERLLGQPLSPEEWAVVERLFHDAYRELLPSCRLANGVPDVLHQWQAIGRSQSLLSMAFHTELMELLVALGLVELFARVDGLRDAVGGGSKAGHLAQHVAALGLDPADVVLIGDVVDDALAAAHVGTACVLVSTGMMTRAALESTGALVVDSLHEALDVLSDNRVA